MISSSQVESALGCWTSTKYAPAQGDPLASIVQSVWLFDGTTALPRERIFPDGTLGIALQLDASYRLVSDIPSEPFPPISVNGMRTTAITIEGPGRTVRVLRINLWPEGACAVQASDLPLVAIAAQAGYYDQPHMNAEFRNHAGMTPHAFRRAQRYPNSTSLAEQVLQDDLAPSA